MTTSSDSCVWQTKTCCHLTTQSHQTEFNKMQLHKFNNTTYFNEYITDKPGATTKIHMIKRVSCDLERKKVLSKYIYYKLPVWRQLYFNNNWCYLSHSICDG